MNDRQKEINDFVDEYLSNRNHDKIIIDNTQVNNYNHLDTHDLEMFIEMKEIEANECNKNNKLKKINEIISKRKTKLNKISEL